MTFLSRRNIDAAFGASLGLAVAAALFVSGGRAPAAETPAAAADATAVNIDNFTFGPKELTVKAGTTVTWTNRDDIPHTVVSAGKFRSKPLDTDNTFAFTFTAAGEYKYFCSLHPQMMGVVKVE